MKCKYCGTEYEDSRYCPNCGSNNDEYVEKEPVKEVEEENVFINTEKEEEKKEESRVDDRPERDKNVAGLLAILLGTFGIHCFYLGRIARGIFSIIFAWTGIPSIIGFFEGIAILVGNDRDFEERYKVKCVKTL